MAEYQYGITDQKCKVCKKFVTNLLDSFRGNVCENCRRRAAEERRRLKTKEEQNIPADISSVLRRRITAALARTTNFNNSRRIEGDSNLTMSFLLALYDKQEGKCAITGRKLSMGRVASKGYEPDLLSVDRIDSTKGYTRDNVQFVTWQANVAKNRHTQKELLEFCRAVIAEADRNPSKFLV